MVDTINPSITAGIGGGQQQINPLGMLGQFAGIQNQLNQNALFQQNYRANAAMGPLAQQSVGPDGQMDWNKFAKLVSTNPDTAFRAPEILNNIASKKLIDAETTNQELTATKSRMDIMAGVWSAAAKDSSVQDVSDLSPYMTQAMSLGGIKDPKDAITFMADPKIQDLKGPEFRQMLLQHALAMQHGSSALTALTNQYDPELGYDPATGKSVPGWRNPVQQTVQPLGSQQPDTNGGGSAQPAVASAPASAAQSGELGETMAAQPQQAAQPTPGQPSPTPPAFEMGQPSEAQKEVWKDTEKMRQDYNASAAHSGQLQLVADKLQEALSKVRGGAGAEAYQEAGKLLQSLGVKNSTVDQVANGSLPAGQTAENLSTTLGTMAVRQLLLSQASGEGSAGRLTNLEFQKIVDIYPDIEKDPRAAKALFNFMRTQNTLAQAKSAAFENTYNLYHAHQPLAGGMQNPTQFENYWLRNLVQRGLVSQGVAKDLLPSVEPQ